MTAPNIGDANGTAQPKRITIFLSYASEDEDIMLAVSDAFDSLKQLSSGNILTLYDKKSIEVGSPVPLIRDISDKLYKSDYLVILYTGSLKKSFSWTGTELGIFWGFIRSDEREHEASHRQIVVIYFDERPPVDWGALGLNLEISSLDLRLSRQEFKQKVEDAIRGGHQQYTPLIKTMGAIGRAADAGLHPALGEKGVDPDEWAAYLAKRSDRISGEIVPTLMAKLHESFSSRVKKTNIEQHLIEFRIPKTFKFSDDGASLPDDTMLVEHGEAFSLFKMSAVDGFMSWGTFKANLESNSEATWITASIQRSAVSAISPDLPRDDEQIIRAPRDGAIFRLIITRRFEFYDGSALVHLYFIPALRFAFLENSATAITLGFINVAVKYRELFINPASDLSVLDYYREPEFDELKSKVRRSIRQLLIVEDESHILKLDQRNSIAKYYGDSVGEAKAIGDMHRNWTLVRKAVIEAAQAVLSTPSTAEDSQKKIVFDNWVEALSKFVRVSDEINSVTLDRSIDKLRLYLFGSEASGVAAAPVPEPRGSNSPSLTSEPRLTDRAAVRPDGESTAPPRKIDYH
jgi:hypothetical protein